jgi:hypothetical protein
VDQLGVLTADLPDLRPARPAKALDPCLLCLLCLCPPAGLVYWLLSRSRTVQRKTAT